jgi:hypothetical protein
MSDMRGLDAARSLSRKVNRRSTLGRREEKVHWKSEAAQQRGAGGALVLRVASRSREVEERMRFRRKSFRGASKCGRTL